MDPAEGCLRGLGRDLLGVRLERPRRPAFGILRRAGRDLAEGGEERILVPCLQVMRVDPELCRQLAEHSNRRLALTRFEPRDVRGGVADPGETPLRPATFRAEALQALRNGFFTHCV